MDEEKLKKKFPSYFEAFVMPPQARDEEITVYRACRSRRLDKDSFLPTFEENNFKCLEEKKEDPSTYSLSTYEKPRDVKRFVTMDSCYQKPFLIAKGITAPQCGPCLRTKEYKEKYKKSSHVDWWLYEDAKPYLEFKLIPDFGNYMKDIKKRGKESGLHAK